MVRYRCNRCAHGFTADQEQEPQEPRCPRCLRKSTVERDDSVPAATAPAVPTEASVRHVNANAWIQAFFILLHVLTFTSVILNLLMITASAQADSPLGGMYELPDGPGEKAGFYGTFACIGVWSGLGLLWTPFNAWGLFMKRPWARTSTMIYWAGSLVTLCCIPFGLYGLWSLWRPDVAALFRGPADDV